jgi:hypothetical protein
MASATTGDIALLANAIATCVMVGVIWFVQVVHYPLLSQFGAAQSTQVAREHQRRTGWVVGIPIAVEGVSTLVLLADRPAGVAIYLPWVGAILLAVALGSTVLLSVPLHSRMVAAHDDTVARKLVRTNWPRTIAWSARAIVCVAMIVQARAIWPL